MFILLFLFIFKSTRPSQTEIQKQQWELFLDEPGSFLKSCRHIEVGVFGTRHQNQNLCSPTVGDRSTERINTLLSILYCDLSRDEYDVLI